MIEIRQSIDLVRQKLPVFIVGAGGIVRDAHLPAYRKAGFSVAGICDIDRGKAEELHGLFPEIAEVYDSPEAFMRRHASDEVVYDIAVPANAVLTILENLPDGAAVLIQKPMGETWDETKAILNVCVRKRQAHFSPATPHCPIGEQEAVGRTRGIIQGDTHCDLDGAFSSFNFQRGLLLLRSEVMTMVCDDPRLCKGIIIEDHCCTG